MKSKEDLEKIARKTLANIDATVMSRCLDEDDCRAQRVSIITEFLTRVQDEALAKYKAFLAGRFSGKHNTMHAQLGNTSEPAPEKK
jgi:hypothetical protein